MNVDREDIVFATCYQLAQLISSEWEDAPGEVIDAINGLTPIDEPGGIVYGRGPLGSSTNPLQLTSSEKEPESVKKLFELKIVAALFKIIIKHSDGWKTQNAEILKKEIVSRIKNYEEEANSIFKPLPIKCNITL